MPRSLPAPAASPRPARPVRRRRARILLLVLGVLSFTGYFAFSTFFFNPLEGSFGRIEHVVPRTVDFYLRKTDLARDFPDFPRPAFWDALEGSEGWRSFLESETFVDLDRRHGLRQGLRELEETIARTPLDPVRDLLGREVALAGTFTGPDVSRASFALYARVSWKVKLGLGALRYGWIRSRFAPGLPVRREGDVLVLERAARGRDLFLARDRDLLVASTDPGLVREFRDLTLRGGADSLGLSAKFHDAIESRRAPPDEEAGEAEVYLDASALSKAMGRPFAWPRPEGGLASRVASNFFSAAVVREGAGIVRFSRGLDLRLRFELNADLLSPIPKKLYGLPAGEFGREIVRGLASMAPRKTMFLGLARGDPGDFARALFRSLDRDQQRLLDDRFRATGKFKDALGFVEEISGVLRDRVGLLLRRNDFPRDPRPFPQGDPKNDGSPAPCWALVFSTSMRNREKVRDWIDFFSAQRARFGIEQPYTIPITGNYQAWEFVSTLVTGTGEIAVVTSGETLIVGNSWKFLNEILQTWFSTTPDRKVADDPSFLAATEGLPGAVSAFAYANGRLLAEALRDLVPPWVEQDLFPDYETERPRAIERIVAEKFPKYRGTTRPKEVEEEVQRLADEEMDRLAAQVRATEEPKLRRRFLDRILWLESAPGVAFLAATDPRRLDLAARLRIEWR